MGLPINEIPLSLFTVVCWSIGQSRTGVSLATHLCVTYVKIYLECFVHEFIYVIGTVIIFFQCKIYLLFANVVCINFKQKLLAGSGKMSAAGSSPTSAKTLAKRVSRTSLVTSCACISRKYVIDVKLKKFPWICVGSTLLDLGWKRNQCMLHVLMTEKHV